MTQPGVTFTESDGALGALPAGARYLVVAGVANAGSTATPAAYAKTQDLVSAFSASKQCPTVEAAAKAIEITGKPVIFLRVATATAGSCSAVTSGITGTCVVTVNASADEPTDDADVRVEVLTGGTVGTAGITYRYAINEGLNFSPEIALGTANTIAIAELGITFDLAAGTLIAGDYWTIRCDAPAFDSTGLGAALDALALSSLPWEILEAVGGLDATLAGVLETKLTSMRAAGKECSWVGHARLPTAGETEAAYLTAMDTAWAAFSSTNGQGQVCAGSCRSTSALSSKGFRRPISFDYAAREYSLSEEEDSAAVDLGALPGVQIRDAYGNTLHHDESANPGLDDLRLVTLRTWDDFAGVYVNRPRLISAAGSDYEILPHRRVMNLAKRSLRAYFVRRTSKPILVDKTTGFILESEAQEIEAGSNGILAGVLEQKPKSSGGGFPKGAYVQISRTDNLLSTKKITGQARIIPLAYPEFIEIDWGFVNPALRVTAV